MNPVRLILNLYVRFNTGKNRNISYWFTSNERRSNGMNKQSILICLVLIGVFCIIASAVCPPLPPCYHQTSGWPRCSKVWNCSTGQTCCNGSCCGGNCQSCVDNSCVVCNGDPNKFCCNNSCCSIPNCQTCGTSGCESACDPDLCQTCDGKGSCESTCDPDLCKSCDGHGNCITCNNDPNQKCCPAIPGIMQASCALPCQTEYGEDCSGTPSFCGGCALNGDCGWQGNSKIYEGGDEKICNPRGCPSDCHDDTKVCYTEYPCIPMEAGAPLSHCTNMCVDPGGYTWPCPPHCEVVYLPFTCYICIGDEEWGHYTEHEVQNDSCNY